MPAARLALLFSMTLIVSAGLLFSVQPMVSKMLLPTLGGAPLVWTTAMVFFQAALLLGYFYAYGSIRLLSVQHQILVHIVLLFAVLLVLPLGVSERWGVPDFEHPQSWLLMVLGGVVAFPFVVIAGSTTLAQNWFAHSSHPRARDPYFLYAASNLGSIIALLAYPLAIEPRLPLATQSYVWSMFYAGFVALVLACGTSVWRRVEPGESIPVAPVVQEARPSPTWSTRMQWFALAFAPSMLLLAVTLHLQTDVAAVPLLWVAPLAVYLLTFVVTFYQREFIPRPLVMNLQAISVALVAILMLNLGVDFRLSIGLHLSVLLFSGLMCHGALASMRPAADHLGEFYLWVSTGGMLGGLAAGVVAPVIFDAVHEYPIALVSVCLLRALPMRSSSLDLTPRIPAAATLGLFLTFNPWYGPGLIRYLPGIASGLFFYGGCLIGALASRKSPLLFSLLITVFIVGMQTPGGADALETIHQQRSFFGVTRVARNADADEWELYNGTTMHGFQVKKTLRHERISTGYYSSVGPIGQIIRAQRRAGSLRDVAVLGLGAGTLACSFGPEERVVFFEIDPVVIEVATNPELFTFISRCGQNVEIEVGDGRLLLEHQADHAFDLTIFDIFSSDAIPAHIPTREALAMYLRKTRPRGLLAFHISSRHLDLGPVLARLADDAGLAGLILNHKPSVEETMRTSALASRWVVLGREAADLEPIHRLGGWRSLDTEGMGDLWTDDFSNVLGAIRIHQ